MTTARTPEGHRSILRSIRVAVFVVLAAMVMTPAAFSAITIFAADCATPQTTFNLGETVCARADTLTGLRLAWINPDGYILHRADLTTDSQVESFTLPSTAESSIAGLVLGNNLGPWRVNAISSTGSAQAGMSFMVRDPANARVDLSVVKFVLGNEQPIAGGPVQFEIRLLNLGPDDAVNAHFVDNDYSNATFNSLAQTGGPTFSCTGADCTIANFPAGAMATFVLNFTAGAAGGVLENTATFTSDTVELRPEDNSTPAPRINVASGGTPPPCTLECSPNLVVSANTTQAGTPGSIVSLPSPQAYGSCGPVTLSPASGSFFPLGTTTVTASASGSGFCSFTVTVIDTPPPTITCPPDMTVSALAGQAEAFVPDPSGAGSDPGIATATGSSVSVIGARSDNRPLSDPYPVGLTLISWRATDDGQRSASCSQRITVTSPDAPTIQCPPNKTFTGGVGVCEITVTAEDIGSPVITGLATIVTFRRSDDLALTAPYPAGQTFLTWTASNILGQVSCVQTIRVRTADTDPPILSIPADITTTTMTCVALLDDELGVATAVDNCGVTVVRTGVPADFVFPTGTTSITYTATDAAGNTATAVQHVHVLELPSIRPMITPPPDVTVSTGTGATTCGVVVPDATLGIATASDNCPGVSVSRTGVAAGNLFPVGETFISYVATDASGSSASATQKVTVLDTTMPTITCPPNLTLEPTCPSGAVATWTVPVGTDNCEAASTSQTAGPANGSVFPIGVTTTVSYTAIDASGNQTSCGFSVTVLTIAATIENLKASVSLSSLQPPTKQGLIPKLETALDGLARGNNTQACQAMRNFVNSVQNYIDHEQLPATPGQGWLKSAAHVLNALGCTNDPCT
jgi:hypothetical protein